MGWTMDNKVDDVPNISGYTIASVLMQFLALMFFFLSLVAFMNGSVIAGIILLAIGAVWEILFVKLVKKIVYWKKQDVKVVADPPAEDFYEPLYKNDGEGYDFSRNLYCKLYDKHPKHLTEEDEEIIWQYTCDDFSFLLAWIIEKDLYQPSVDDDEDEAEESREDAAKIKARDMLPSEYLKNNGGYFMEDEVKESARKFVKEYYKGAYLDEVRTFAKEKLGSQLYGFPFRWEDYDEFKVHIDESFEKYGGNANG